MKSIKTLLSFLTLAIILSLFIYYIFNHISDFRQLSIVNYWFIIILAIIILLSSTLNGQVTDKLVSTFGIKLKFKEWFGLSVITTFYNIITPFKGGMAARAVYLKKKHEFSYANFLAALAGTYVLSFLVAAFLGLVSLFFLYQQLKIFNLLILLIFLSFFIPLLVIVVFSPKFPETKYTLINKIINILNGWHLIHKKRKIILLVSVVATIQLLMGAIGIIISYYIFAINISFAQALFISSVTSFAILISITPAGLGIQEAISVFCGLVIGITPAQALSVAILNRAMTMIIIFILGPIFSYILLKHDPKQEEHKAKDAVLHDSIFLLVL
jgi:uncharacterized protein (TIRG00374 family)